MNSGRILATVVRAAYNQWLCERPWPETHQPLAEKSECADRELVANVSIGRTCEELPLSRSGLGVRQGSPPGQTRAFGLSLAGLCALPLQADWTLPTVCGAPHCNLSSTANAAGFCPDFALGADALPA